MRRLLACAALLALCSSQVLGATSQVHPPGPSPTVAVGKAETAKDYYLLPPEGLLFRLEGPGTLSGFAKIHLDAGVTGPLSAELQLSGIAGLPAALPLSLKASSRGAYADGRPGTPSRGARISLEIPAGQHELKVAGEDLFVILYYDGPAQWGTVVAEKPKPKKPRKLTEQLGFTWRSGAGLKFTYDDNAYKMSEDYKDEYRDRLYWNEEKFQKVNRLDDLILAPNLSLEGRRKKLLPWGQTRIGFRYAGNAYLHNTALFNHEFRVYMRQYMGPGSLELYYNYSPSKYLRQLNDRPPLVSGNTPVVSEEFRLERNKLVAVWRQKLHKRVSSTIQVTRKLYYYNEPHLENDMNTTDISATFGIKLAKPFSLKLQYEYSDAKARAIDVVGQELATSSASDGTYKQNKYNTELSWKWPLQVLSSKLTLRAQYVVAYFSAYGDIDEYSQDYSDTWVDNGPDFALAAFDGDGPIAVDTYHTGRVDNVYTFQVKGGRKMPVKLQELMGWDRSISMSYGFGYAERDVDSPWWGDIKEDKNWISRTYWLGFSTRLF
jgi:hypothetical protein